MLAELATAFLAGAAVWVGLRAAQTFTDPYSAPRLTLGDWLERGRGGEPA